MSSNTIADYDLKDQVVWTLEAPTGESYTLTYHKSDKKWTVDELTFDEEADDWTGEEIYSGPQPPKDILTRCGVTRLVS